MNKAVFDENLPKFEQSIQTIKIGKPGGIQQAISRFGTATP
jgi:hypothetical protein